MPIPKPHKDENHDEFVSRCMGDDVMQKEFPDKDQRYAICQRQWDDKDKKSKANFIDITPTGMTECRITQAVFDADDDENKKSGSSLLRGLPSLYSSIWSMIPERFQLLADFVNKWAANPDGGYFASAFTGKQARDRDAQSITGTIAVIPIAGLLTQHETLLSFLFGTPLDWISSVFDSAMKNDSVGAVVLDVDSPGGSLYGVQELSDKIYRARNEKKPIVAVANSVMASAAYWIASAADQIVVTPSGEAGSIGVLAIHQEASKAEEKEGIKTTIIKAGKYKVEGNPHEPLSTEGAGFLQSRVDDYYATMLQNIARNRGTTPEKVEKDFGEGHLFGAKQAKKSGMVDRIATLENVLAGLISSRNPNALANKARLDARKTGLLDITGKAIEEKDDSD